MAKLLSGTRIYGTATVDTQLFVSGSNAASSTITGALQVVGGVGVGGDLYVGGDTSKFGVGQTQLTINNLGGWPSLGGSNGIALYANNQQAVVYTNLLATHQFRLDVNNTTAASSTTTGALTVAGGVGIGKAGYFGGNVTAPTFIGSLTGVATTSTNLAGGAGGSLPYQTSAGITAMLSLGTNGFVLTAGATAPQWTAISGLSAGLATTATNIAGGTAGQVPYQTGPGATSFYGPGTAGQILLSGGSSGPSYANTSTFLVGRSLTADQATTATLALLANTATLALLANTATLALLANTATLALLANTATLALLATTATNVAGGAAGSLHYQSSAGITAMLGISTTAGFVLSSTGSVPQWASLNSLGAGSATTSSQVNTVLTVTNAIHFLTFVDSNNTTPTGELVYTTSSFSINPNTGYIGMGTNNPQRPLHVVTLGTATQGIAAFEANASGLAIQDNGGQNGNVEIIGYKQTAATYHNILIRGVGSGLLVQSSTGNVGIGNLTPSTNLTIGGTAASGGASGGLGAFLSRGVTTNFYEAFDGTKSYIAGVDDTQSFAKAGTLSGHDLAIVTGNGAKIYIQNSTGNVGIGTEIPRVKFSIDAGTVAGVSELVNLHNQSTTNGNGTSLTFSGYNPTSSHPTWRFAGIKGLYDTTSTGLNAGGWGGQLRLFVNRGGAADQFEDVVTITGGGHVGIGTNSPDIYSSSFPRQLTVQSTSGYANITVAGGPGAVSNGGGIDFGTATVRHAGLYSLPGSALGFYTNAANTGTSLTERLRITAAGGISFGASGTAVGTSGQILQSSGDAPPIWVSPDTLASASATTATNVVITNDTSTITPQFLAFVSTSTGNTGIKTAAISGLNYIASSGYLGIGVNPPTAPVHIVSSVNSVLRFRGASTGQIGILFSDLNQVSLTNNAGAEAYAIFPATNSLALSTNATNRITVDLAGQVKILANIESTAVSTGSLVVTGGVGISSNLYVGGLINGGNGARITGVVTATTFVGNLTGNASGTAGALSGGAAGSLPYQTGAGITAMLAISTAGYFLTVNAGATAPQWTQTLGVSNGGTGVTTLTGVAFGNGTSAFTAATGAQISTALGSTNITGSAANVTGTVLTSNGGTGLTSWTAGDLPYYASGTALTKLAIGTSGFVLTSSGTAPQWTALTGLSAGTATTATNIAGGAANQIPYQSAAGSTAFSSNLTWTNSSNTFGVTGTVAATGALTRLGAVSSTAWTITSPVFHNAGTLLTDTSAATGTVGAKVGVSFHSPNFASTNVITVTDAVNLYLQAPVASTNVTFTNNWGLYNQGNTYLNGNVGIGRTTVGAKLDVFQENTFNATTPGLTTAYGIHLSGQATNDNATGITFSAGGAAAGNANAGIYSQGSGSYGTKMYFATTDSYATGAKTRLIIDHDGNVGIGTISPSAKFTINNSGSTAAAFYANIGNPSNAITLFEHTGASTPVPFRLRKSGFSGASPNYGLLYLHMNDNTVGNGSNLYFNLNNAAGTEIEYAGLGASIRSNTTGSEQGDLNFYVIHNGTGRTERMRITSSGAIAFSGASSYGSSGQVLQSNGNAAPTWINQSSITSGATSLTNTYVGYGSASNLLTGSSSLTWNGSNLYVNGGITSNSNTPLSFQSNGNAGTYNQTVIYANQNNTSNNTANGIFIERGRLTDSASAEIRSFVIGDRGGNIQFILNKDGNVGIGVTSPGSKLSVSGANSSSVPLLDLTASGTGTYQRGVRLLNSGMNVGDHIMMAVGTADSSRNMGQFYFYNAGAGSTSNRLSMGLHSVDDVFNIVGTSYVGIGTTAPVNKFEVKGTFGGPLTSGSSQNGIVRFSQTAGGGSLDIGFGDPYSWIQSRQSSDYSTNYRLALNPNGGNVCIGTTSTTNKFEVAGAAGQLFSVSDSFTGTIFSANDVSGIPSIEVLDTGLVKLAQYNGAVTIGTGTVSSSTAELSVYGMLYTSGPQGEIRASNEITAYFSSDRRLKENIKLIENPITIIDQIRGVTFDWTDEHMARRGGEDGYFVRKHDIGVIAQEVQAVLPELVGTREDGYLAVKYEKMVPLLIEAIKEQQKTIDSLVKDLVTVKEFINNLKNGI